MAANKIDVRFWGVRGGIPTANEATHRFGGNTPCVEVRCGKKLIIFDAGTGLCPLGRALDHSKRVKADIFFSGSRFDHLCGLPFFHPGYNAKNAFKVWAGHLGLQGGIHGELTSLMTSPLFPIPLSFIAGIKDYGDFTAGETLKPHHGITLHTAPLKHPFGATGYRLTYKKRALCYVSNTAHVPNQPDQAVIELIRDADLVIYDSYYFDEEYPSDGDIGHSTWQEGARLCAAAGAKRLVAFQHHPAHDDASLKRAQGALDAALPGSVIAYEGLTIGL